MKKMLLVALVLMAFMLASLAGAQTPVTIVVAQGADITSIDPHTQNDQPTSRVRAQIYDTLIRVDEKLQLQPSLATSWKQIDSLTWEFKLRANVKFHNGETLAASDVKFSLERLANPATKAAGAFIVGFLDKVEVIDNLTFRIKSKNPFAPLLSHLGHTVCSILNEKAVKAAGPNYGTQTAVGTGPFKFVSWSVGSHVTLDRFDEHWRGPAKVGRVMFRAIPEGTVRAIELEAGGVDIVYAVEPIDEARLSKNKSILLPKTPTMSTSYIGFNCNKAPFNNVLVRQAINHAINVDAVVKTVYTGQATKANGPISSLVWGYNPNLKGYPYNPTMAKDLLTKAGYANGFKTTIWTNDNPLRMQIAEMVQSDLAKIGVQVSIQVLPWATYLEDTAAGKHDMFILGWVSVTGDADYGLYALFHSSMHGNAGNRTFYTNKKVDELLNLGRTSGDPQKRLTAYYEAQQIIADDAPWLFLIVTEEVTGMRNNISGFVPHPAGHHWLYPVTKN